MKGNTSVATDTAHARADLGASIALALSDAEDYMATAEAQHKAIGGDVIFNDADQRASLSECLLSHRVVAMLRQLAEMVPAPPPACGACGDVDRVNCAVCG